MIVKINEIKLQDLQGPNFLQSRLWGEFKASGVWKSHAFDVSCDMDGNQLSFHMLVMFRPLAAGYHIGYVPFGPDPGIEVPDDCDCMEQLSKQICQLLPYKTLYIRYDIPWYLEGEDAPQPVLCPPMRKAAMDIQPPATVVLDLTKSEEDLLAAMKPKTRYNIRLSEKKGVEISTGTAEDLRAWYELYKETAQRDHISIHDFEYYSELYKRAQKDPDCTMTLYNAHHEGDYLAGNLAFTYKDQGTYIYGASSNHKRNLMPAYGLQWKAICDLKAAGIKSYDLYGIPVKNDSKHGMFGLYRFKIGFGGRVLHRAGSWDFTPRRFAYFIYRRAESLRNWYHRVFKKRK